MTTSHLDSLHNETPLHSATRNACKLCAPLGASLALAGVERTVTILHGSQGCATYIRRYMISHFREPVDIASSSFGEEATIFGGKANLLDAIRNVNRQYAPALIGIATTCLAETIGDDVAMHLHDLRAGGEAAELPPIVHVSTPSYSGTHAEGYFATLRALVEQLVEPHAEPHALNGSPRPVNLIAGMISPADLRDLKEILLDFGLSPILLPDYSDTLDGPAWSEYHVLPKGGTQLEAIRRMGHSLATIELATTPDPGRSAGAWLQSACGVPLHRIALPMGVLATDAFFDVLRTVSGRPTPCKYVDQRGRLIDAMVDAHKYLFGKKAVVYGEEDLVLGIASLLAEIGVVPVLCASGGKSGRLPPAIAAVAPEMASQIEVLDGVDFARIEDAAERCRPDLVIGHSKGFSMARRLGAPLVRVGFPIHDRIGGPRMQHIGYQGTQQLFDRVVNALMESAQNASPIGYSYI